MGLTAMYRWLCTSQRVRRREAQLDAWRADCQKVRDLKEETHDAKVQAQADYAGARTQQEAERAEVRLPARPSWTLTREMLKRG